MAEALATGCQTGAAPSPSFGAGMLRTRTPGKEHERRYPDPEGRRCGRRPTPTSSRTPPPRTSCATWSRPRARCRCWSISGRPGAAPAASSRRSWRRPCARRRARSGWSSSISTSIRRSRAKWACSRSPPCSPSRTDARSTASWARCLKSRVNAFIARLIGDSAGRYRRRSRSRGGGARRRRRQHRGADLRRNPASRTARTRKPRRPRQVLHQDRRPRPRRADARAGAAGKGRERAGRKRARGARAARKAAEHGRRRRASRQARGRSERRAGRFDLALALNAKGDRDGALEELLALVAKNRAWNDDAARKQLVQLFDAWGADAIPPRIAGRQRLSSLLFA